MGSILKFVLRSDRAVRRAPVEGGSTRACEIVIFPGVRYERWEDDSAKPTPQKKKKARKRRAR